MSKYDNLKFFEETKARFSYSCDKCGGIIKGGEIYFAEKIEKVNVPGLKLKKICKDCYKK